MQPLLSIKNLSVHVPHDGISSQVLIDNVSCQLQPNEILCIIGSNGAGKSTLLKAISGDVSINSGEIEINALSDNPILRARQLAVLGQFSVLNFPYRVCEVVNLGRIPHQTGKKIDQEIVDQALEAMDIMPLKYRLYTELSGGEKQRVQLARVLAQIWRAQDIPNKHRLLILDEPTSSLDLGHQQKLMQAIKSFAKQGVGVIMVLHDINLAACYADKLLALLDGKAIAYGKVEQVIKSDVIDKLFNINSRIIEHPVHGSPFVITS